MSPYLISIAVAWLGSHVIKYIVSLIKKEKYGLRSHLFMSGGMPSAHSATAVALTTVIGLTEGIDSGLFGMSVLFALIVMYDAMKVRRSSGEQGIALRKLIRELKSDIKLPRAAKGHTPIEVAFGATLGLIIGTVVFLSTR